MYTCMNVYIGGIYSCASMWRGVFLSFVHVCQCIFMDYTFNGAYVCIYTLYILLSICLFSSYTFNSVDVSMCVNVYVYVCVFVCMCV